MARTVKSRREAYDAIAVGSLITTRERTINGALPPAFTTYGNTENIAVGVDYGFVNDPVGTDVLVGERVGGA
jgi:hypothetical protein